MAKIKGNDVNMMPGFMVAGLACFGMPYGAQTATWIEIGKAETEWIRIRPVTPTVKYQGDEDAS